MTTFPGTNLCGRCHFWYRAGCRLDSMRTIGFLLGSTALLCPMDGLPAQSAPPSTNSIVERVGDTGFIQLQADSFRALEPRGQALAYWLTQASIAIDPIVYDQLSPYGLREKRLLEEIVARPSGIPSATFEKFREYALLFWANRGNHNETTGQKFVPAFSADELQQAAL